jgi:site-specific DNA recombinase
MRGPSSTPITPLTGSFFHADPQRRALLSGAAPTVNGIAKSEGVKPGYARRMLRLAFLAPDLKHAILDGRASQALTLQRIMTEGLPDSWAKQRKMAAA